MKSMFLTVAMLAGTIFCHAQTDIVKDNFKFADKQLRTAVEDARAGRHTNAKGEVFFSPRTIEKNGRLRLVSIRDWTAGFFPGSLWYQAESGIGEGWQPRAEEFTALMHDGQFRTNTHDIGFLMCCSVGNAYRITKKEEYKQTLIRSARALITRYHATVKSIRSWDHNSQRWEFPVIIDNMMNLELLFWAAKATGERQFYDIAVDHANTTLKNHFREDHSTYHVVVYNPRTGEAVLKVTHQGLADASSWARGQAWAVYGYTVCYRETGDQRFLEQAKNTAKFIFSHPRLPEDLIPYWDYDDPRIPDNTPRDVSAATVTASALYELSMYDKENGAQYKAWADTILENITKSYRAQPGSVHGFLLLHSTGNMPKNDEIDKPINYADYYFLEALTRKAKLEKEGTAILD